ncbi:cell envelope-related function transcriptional attenuator, LytR/CpsA family [Salinispora tropica CNB-440]|uniref:Cell envelope-related function transcriptional attenuator, LytR/CpsA family n=2 Tax=Salinispora tropica TaxID=168695 RepID=A4XDD2_SALTO|nr:cell envelope-related function transcriptional attenuator, LytR/CpsA family [Salinispora tropica CNB-440]
MRITHRRWRGGTTSRSKGGRERADAGVRRGRPRWARLLLGLGLALVLLAGLAAVGLHRLTQRYDKMVTREELLDSGARRGQTDLNGPLNYLLVGTDRWRSSSSTADRRSDTILIVHVPAGGREAFLMSIPRDLRVTIPAAHGFGGGEDKINAAYQHGGGGQSGTRLLSATITQLTDIRFDGAAVVDFSGFRDVIDHLGGVRMCVDTEFRSIHTDRVFTPGCQEMDGGTALDFVRQRYDLPNGDYDRQTHQQQLLRAVLQRASETSIRNNPVRLDQVIRAVGSSLTVDTNGVPLADLVLALRDLPTDALRGIQMPSYPQTIDQVSYVILQEGGGGLFTAVQNQRVPQWAQANPRWVTQL